ncbi:MAG: hypothetical protein P8127_05565 [Acidobacteriota bacterium]
MLAIENLVLKRIDDIEAGNPQRHRTGEHESRPVDPSGFRDPRSDRCDSEREPEPQVGSCREAFGVGVEEQYGQSRWRQGQTQRAKRCRREQKNQCGGTGDDPRELSSEPARGQCATGGSRILEVDVMIRKPVESHRCGPRRDHRHQDP